MPNLFLPILTGWCAVWLVLAGIGFLFGLRCTRGPETHRWFTGFWVMTIFWVAVDLVIVVWALLAPVDDVAEFQKLLLINSGLDVVYIIVGGILVTRKDRLASGFGAAIILQGVFLLGFDLAWWWILGQPAA